MPALFGLPLAAQEYASHQRGLSADTAYQVGEIDSVNLFNGQLSLRIPIGPRYPVSPALSYGLRLTYSANGWDHDPDNQCVFDGELERYSLPFPDPRTNAGFGWSVHFGLLEPPEGPPPYPAAVPWTYVSPDGGQHRLYPELHPGYPATNAQPDARFSNDATYLRMRRHANPAGICGPQPSGAALVCRTVEFPDGTVHEFRDFGSPTAPEWRITRMRDRFTGFVDVEYPSGDTWHLTDSQGRTQILKFALPAFAYDRLIRAEQTKPGGGPRAVYDFHHQTVSLRRPDFFPPACAPPEHGPRLDVPVLTGVDLPDGSFYRFDFYSEHQPGTGQVSGGVRELRLPTGGGYRWAYQGIEFVSQQRDFEPYPGADSWASIAPGVATKELYTDLDDPPIGTWIYAYLTAGAQLPRVPGDVNVPCHHEVTVTDPLGHEAVHYFSSSAALHHWSYGLPFTRCGDGSYDPAGPFLSQEIYEGSADSGTKVRSVFVEYGSDGRDGGIEQDKNHRQTYRKVVYHDDGDRFVETSHSDFDGLGHFRAMSTAGSFLAGDSRSQEMTYNPGRGTLVIDPETSDDSGSTFVMPAYGEPSSAVISSPPRSQPAQGSEHVVTPGAEGLQQGCRSSLRLQ